MLNVLVIHDGGPDVHLDHAYHLDAKQHGLLLADTADPSALHQLGCFVQNMDRVVISCPMERRAQWTFALRAAGTKAELVSESLHELGAIGLSREAGFTSIVISKGPLGIRARATKRLLDLAITIPALIFLMPLMIAVAIAIRLEDGGPVFFRQRRLGLGNRFFNVLKFRSMRTEQTDAAGHRSVSRDDERITRVGRVLRKTSLDELPQLLNVLSGEMSLVGPRPHALGSLAGSKLFWEVDVQYWRRHALKPGLTGLAQVRGFRGATEQESDLVGRLKADLEYISHWSPWRDLAILMATFRVLVHDRAY
jgi:polysaccharide biosynthesis protein PslA